MSSNQLAERWSGLRARSPRRWSLRARLLAAQTVLLAIVCVVIGTATVLSLQQYLVHELDQQLIDAGQLSVRVADGTLPPPPSGFSDGPGPVFLDAPGQRPGTVGAVIKGDRVTDAGALTSTGSRAALSESAKSALQAIPVDEGPRTVEINGLGNYRVLATKTRAGDVAITGLPLGEVDATLFRVLLIFTLAAVAALIAAITLGILMIRRALRPLTRVAATARGVGDLELDRGEVELPVRVPEIYTDPSTEVGQVGSALNWMLDHVAAALSSRQASETRARQFVADASHELRTPLAAIRGYAELAQRERPDMSDKVAHAMSRVDSEAKRMTRLVDDLLLLARLDFGRTLEREDVDLSRLVLDAVSDAHIAGSDHDWKIDLPDEPVYVVGDAERLHQVLVNLLANARTHTGPGTTVTTTLRADDDGGVVLSVEDNGPGIPPELESEVFERFSRGDTSRSRRAGSTGLGLAIVAAVVKAHRGSIDVRSVPGRTVFTVRLPRRGVGVGLTVDP
ncbi:sensor histidine kinase [Antrihabitans stalactiti]|uniref:histidine kinase n=1 Tax=Antrihabitans stalactiti TaxID=2584121 RepID=A0A848KSL6_9NOCA|nr:HAMP domain-containing sensor histidine kinase [Antrihabitans stalactiti]NMN99230.1 HAMP domain-containing histidine kinase [Antrihabitans stalactiti]